MPRQSPVYRSEEEKRRLIGEYDTLPEGRTGQRTSFLKKHGINPGTLHAWKKDFGYHSQHAPKPKQGRPHGAINKPALDLDPERILRQIESSIAGVDAYATARQAEIDRKLAEITAIEADVQARRAKVEGLRKIMEQLRSIP